jgi:hypothetical protein
MLKGIAEEKDGRKVVLIGLSRKNLEILMAEMLDTHIRVSGKEMGIPMDILIFSGETEEVMSLMMTQKNTKMYLHSDE